MMASSRERTSIAQYQLRCVCMPCARMKIPILYTHNRVQYVCVLGSHILGARAVEQRAPATLHVNHFAHFRYKNDLKSIAREVKEMSSDVCVCAVHVVRLCVGCFRTTQAFIK